MYSLIITTKELFLKAPITTAADDIHIYFFIVFFPEKIRLGVSSESSAKQRIHMKNQALFSSKDKSKKLKCRLLRFLCAALRVNTCLSGYCHDLSLLLHYAQPFKHPAISLLKQPDMWFGYTRKCRVSEKNLSPGISKLRMFIPSAKIHLGSFLSVRT